MENATIANESGVSFVDRKLLQDAFRSPSMTGSVSRRSRPAPAATPGRKPNNDNWRDRNSSHEKSNYNWEHTNRRSNGKRITNGQQSSPVATSKKEVIIYYNDPKVDENFVKEAVEKVQCGEVSSSEMKVVGEVKSRSTNGDTSHRGYSPTNGEKTSPKAEEVPNIKTEPMTIYYGTATEVAKTLSKVIEPDQVEIMETSNEVAPSANESAISPLALTTVEFTPSSSSDPNDVITGGMPIDPPALPLASAATADGRHRLTCTLVSHPGHFYIRFENVDDQKQLDTMHDFYNGDEAIELTVDVLRAGQYFAASRVRPGRKEWVRVQLLHVDSAEMINCLLIDEGCFGVFRLSDLQPLYSPFRAVSKQAIRAEIEGIQPPEKHKDWLPKQALEFKSLVSGRPLYVQLDANRHQAQLAAGTGLQLSLLFGENAQGEADELHGKSVASALIDRGLAEAK